MDVGLALRNSSKGRIKYDKYWAQEGRTKEVLDEISKFSTKISLSVSPKVLSIISAEIHAENDEKKAIDSVPVVISSPSKSRKPAPHVTDAYFYELQSEMELPILEYEEERLKYIQDIFNSKKSEFDSYSSELQQQMKQEYLLLKRKSELVAKRRVGDLQKIEDAILEEAREKEMLQREQYQTHVKKLSAKVLEAELKQKKAEEELRKREQEQKELRVQLENCQSEAQNLVAKSMEKLTSCEHLDHLSIPRIERMDQMAKILLPISNFMAKTNELTIDDILNANLHVKAAYETFHDILNDIDSAKTKALRHNEKLVSFSFKERSVSPKIFTITDNNNVQSNSLIAEVIPVTQSSEVAKSERSSESMDETALVEKSREDKKKLLSQFIAPDAIGDHHKIMENLKRVENLSQPLKTDPRNKKYRFELQKAINVPINSLSSNSGSQIKGKINQLLSILIGKVPEIHGRDMSSDSAVYSFCSHLIAKQFVKQGDTQISAQHSTAFPIAMAILGVWNKKPDVGSLLLGHFYTLCPYLVPYYPPREEGQTDFDYYTVLGYHFDDDGKVEEKYKFLNRMSGYVRLYAAIIVSHLPSNVKSSHPHGIAHGWKWLSRILNLDPRPDITATVLFDFLEVTGHSLQKAYGKQFKKMLHILCKDYFQKIKHITPVGSGGPVERLENFLQQTVKKGYIQPPDGILEPHFWNR